MKAETAHAIKVAELVWDKNPKSEVQLDVATAVELRAIRRLLEEILASLDGMQ